jgi:hypothetical protein
MQVGSPAHSSRHSVSQVELEPPDDEAAAVLAAGAVPCTQPLVLSASHTMPRFSEPSLVVASAHVVAPSGHK